MKTRTPPKGVAATGSVSGESAIRREVVVDAGCEEVFQDHFGARTGSFRTHRIDVARHLASGDVSVLSKASVVLLGPETAAGAPIADVVAQLRSREPHVAIYVITIRLSEVERVMPKLALAGVDEVFPLETRTDARQLEKTLRTRLSAPSPEIELRLLWKWFSKSPERSLVMHCVRNGFRLDDWAVRGYVFSACRKTLQNRVAVLGIPSPGLLARCGRVLHAQELERLGVGPTTRVAEILGFVSAAAMQRTRRRLRKALMTRGKAALMFASLLK